MIVERTPLESYNTIFPKTSEDRYIEILIKREDLCSPHPGPGFGKMRGVVAHLAKIDAETIGVLDTVHSKAGWAVAYAFKELGKTCVNYFPVFKIDKVPPELLGIENARESQREAFNLGAKLIGLKAGRSAILYHAAKKNLKRFDNSYIMPNALKLPESVDEVAREFHRTPMPKEGSVVVSVSSGTIAAGVLRGLAYEGILDAYTLVLHLGYSRSLDAVREYVAQASGVDPGKAKAFLIVDERYGYADAVDVEAPFPVNSHYDAKAWKWLMANAEKLPEPITFWNM